MRAASADFPVVETHRREHERISRADILARMVPLQEPAFEPEPESQEPEPSPAPLAPQPEQPAPDHSSYCSLAQPAPLPVCLMAWHPPIMVAHAPMALPNTSTPVSLLTGIAGRAPPQISHV